MDPLTASDAMLRRVRLMAQFIMDNYPNEFSVYWREHYGAPNPAIDTLAFLASDDLPQKLMLCRKVIVPW